MKVFTPRLPQISSRTVFSYCQKYVHLVLVTLKSANISQWSVSRLNGRCKVMTILVKNGVILVFNKTFGVYTCTYRRRWGQGRPCRGRGRPGCTSCQTGHAWTTGRWPGWSRRGPPPPTWPPPGWTALLGNRSPRRCYAWIAYRQESLAGFVKRL